MKTLFISSLLILCVALGIAAQSGSVRIRITGIRSEKGQLRLSFYTDQESFEKENPEFEVKISKSTIRNGEIFTERELPVGVYGIALIDDENANGEMDYNRLGLPTEGFGFSNIMRRINKRPKFREFQFSVGTEEVLIVIPVNYL